MHDGAADRLRVAKLRVECRFLLRRLDDAKLLSVGDALGELRELLLNDSRELPTLERVATQP